MTAEPAPTARMVELIREQALGCRELGSPFYGVLLGLLADDVAAGGAAAQVLAGHERDPGPSALALRLAGTVHRMVLAGTAPALAAHFPSTGGDGDAAAAWTTLRGVLAERPEEVRAGLASAPQTNEVGRSAALLGGLLHVLGPSPLPVRLWEIGAAGGLNLHADRFRYVAATGEAWGPDSPVVLDPAWSTVPEGAVPSIEVVERVGGDVAPIDVTSEDGALRLASYVWPDQAARLERLRGAIAVARTEPARLVTAGAAELLETLELNRGALTVVWHSVMWQYLPLEERERASARIDELGAAATPEAPFAHISFEPRRLVPGGPHRFCVTVRAWPGGQERILGQAHPHGVPVTWRPVT